MKSILKEDLKQCLTKLKNKTMKFNLIYINDFIFQTDTERDSVSWENVHTLLTRCREILANRGFLALRCHGHDKYKYKIILDAVFEKKRFKNEIFIKARQEMEYNPESFKDVVDSIFIYATDENLKINTIFSDKAATSPSWHGFDSKGQGKPANFSITENPLYLDPPVGTHWKWKQSTITQGLENYAKVPAEHKTSHSQFFKYIEKFRSLPPTKRPRFLRLSKTNRPYYLVYGREEVINTFWDDIETTANYQGSLIPSQDLLKRLINLLSNEKDDVLIVNFGEPALLELVQEMGRNTWGIEERQE